MGVINYNLLRNVNLDYDKKSDKIPFWNSVKMVIKFLPFLIQLTISQTTTPSNTQNETSTFSPKYLEHWKTSEQMIKYTQDLNKYAKEISKQSHFQVFENYLLTFFGKKTYHFLPGDTEFYRQEFEKFDKNSDGFLNKTEQANRVEALAALMYPNILRTDPYHEYNGTWPEKLPFDVNINFVMEKANKTFESLNYESFAYIMGLTDLIHGYTLFRRHDSYARAHNRSPENFYICIAEFGWMARYWINLLGIYDGGYNDRRKPAFYHTFSITNDHKMKVLELAAWRARMLKHVFIQGKVLNDPVDGFE